MLRPAMSSIQPAVRNIAKDRVNFVMALIPTLIGLVLFYFAGSWIYETVMGEGRELIDQYVSKESWGSVLYFLAASVLTVMLFFMVNWTFVLVVTLIASPFNDILSSRIEKKMRGGTPLDLGESFARLLSRIFFTLFNEIKKISFIIVMSVLSFVFGYIPILTPVSVFLAVLLLSIEFLDYSWSRHDMKFGDCVRDLKTNWVGYSFGGAFFFIVVSVPLINLVVPSLATSYFTTLWVKNHESRR